MLYMYKVFFINWTVKGLKLSDGIEGIVGKSLNCQTEDAISENG